MDFHVMAVAREEMRDSAEIAAFFGRYYAITSLVGIVLLAGPAARVLGALGATRALAVTPLTTLVMAVLASFVPGLGPAVALRGTARVLKQTLWSNSQEQMQSPIAHSRRAETRAAIRGVLAPLGYAVAAVLLALVPAHVDGRWLAALTALLSFVMLALVVSGARGAYVAALERAVDERRLVLGTGRLRRAPVVDTEAAAVLAREITSPDADRAELAAEVLGAAPVAAAHPPLVLGLEHPSADVRRASAESLGRLLSLASMDALVTSLGARRRPRQPCGARALDPRDHRRAPERRSTRRACVCCSTAPRPRSIPGCKRACSPSRRAVVARVRPWARRSFRCSRAISWSVAARGSGS